MQPQHRKFLKNIAWGMAIFLFSCSIIILYLYFATPFVLHKPNAPIFEDSLPVDSLLKKQQLQADNDALISFVESVHPALASKHPASYTSAKQTFLEEASHSQNVLDYSLAISKYLSSLNDSNTYIPFQDPSILDFSYTSNGEEVLFENNVPIIAIKSTPPNEESFHITSMKQIQTIITKTFPLETSYSIERYINTHLNSMVILKKAGFIEQEHISLILADKTEVFVSPKSSPKRDLPTPASTCDIIDSAMHIVYRDGLTKEEENLFLKQLEKKLTTSIDTIVLDLRSTKGSDRFINQLKRILFIKTFDYAMKYRFSELSTKQVGYFRKSGTLTTPSTSTAANEQNYRFFIITDHATSNSALRFAISMRDSNLASILGTPSAFLANHFDNPLILQLPCSKLLIYVSHIRYTRPVVENGRLLIPDYPLTDMSELPALLELAH